MKAVMYGAGNIGRGFIGKLLSESGYDVSFIDVNPVFIEKLNTEHQYPVRILYKDTYEEVMVKNVSCIDGKNVDDIANAIAEADIMCTAIGVNVLKFIFGNIAAGLKKRFANPDAKPLNIIICENLIGADAYIKENVANLLTDDEKKILDEKVGFVEASIGRMVPAPTPEMQGDNPLRIGVESYETLPVDKAAFKGEIPYVKNMVPFTPFEFYIQRKLFLHNMGHAISAYLGAIKGVDYIWQSMDDPAVELIVSRAMKESAIALSEEHNVAFRELDEHVEDLLFRFKNRQLGDTVKRVGNDITRKLNPNDRLVGALLNCQKHGSTPKHICFGIAAAMSFPFDETSNNAPETILKDIAKLDESNEAFALILDYCKMIKDGKSLKEIMETLQEH